MAIFDMKAFRHAEATTEDALDTLSRQIASLRKEVASITESVNDYSGSALGDVQHNARAIAKEVRRGSQLVARQVARQASHAGEALRDNPVPVLVALGTLALLTTLIFSRD
jgi:multidrug resistance efflux pump